ncbi:hypothetical protein ACFVAV_25715 [Nocardia sp. NPDC057663]|uniref:hypothetical protein n=1 Tax=Nocardia sp. NPDC057663 TaxID=3346201 RepID=UPI00366E99DC
MSSIYFEPNGNLSVTGRDRRASPAVESSIAPLAMPGLIIGLVLVVLGLAALLRLADWAGNYGPVLVILAYAFYMAAAVRLVQWGVVTVRSLHRR